MEVIGTIIVLLIIASLVHQWARKIKIPYTILLFVIGALLGVGINYFGGISLGVHFTPELLFFVFLPVLIFESGYSIKYHYLSMDYLTIWTLAIVGVLISTGIIGLGLRWILGLIGIEIPLIILLLFGVIISATDPVAVLAIFKHMGVPKRLRLLFEGESLFNDGTALALFLILLSIATQEQVTMTNALEGLGTFFMMVLGGILLGTLCGVVFSYIIKAIKNNERAEITLTMILAHATFFLAEYIGYVTHDWVMHLHFSGVIATAYAALIMGNFGKTKISPKVEEYMEKFWEFFSFVCNALVFLLMGMMVQAIHIPFSEIRPILIITIIMVVIARAVCIYVPLSVVNFFRLCRPIPKSWQHLLAWGSLRGAMSIVMVLLIPDTFTVPGRAFDYSPKQLILVMVITQIIFSLLVKGLTTNSIIKRMNIDKLYDLEEFEKYESEVLVYTKIIEKIQEMKEHYHISTQSYEQLMQKYTTKIEESHLKMELFLNKQPDSEGMIFRALSLHALGIERQYLKEMFTYNEMPENLYHYMNGKISTQIARVRQNLDQIRGFDKPETCKTRQRDPLMWLLGGLQHTTYDDHDAYIINRTRMIVSSKVLEALEMFGTIDFGYDPSCIERIKALYQQFYDRARTELEASKDVKNVGKSIESILLNKGLAKTEEHVIADLLAKDMITEKLYQKFTHEIEEELLRAY